MSLYYLDTSALVKRYIAETDSAWLISQVEPASNNIAIVSELTPVEMFSIFTRRQRDKSLSPSDAAQQRTDFLIHLQTEYLVAPVDNQLLVQARNLVNTHPLRTLDAVQLACALWVKQFLAEPITFLSADRNLLTIAAAEGFKTDDPNAHP
ncbi:MAG: type II toxin-antitoxin system VapC family toxin [Anaerolineae bacterium]|nr:type II toxin-antitoxin system VapC family toxin [Anaerolineae bacterium]